MPLKKIILWPFFPLPLFPRSFKNSSHIQKVPIIKIADQAKFCIKMSPHCSDQRLTVVVLTPLCEAFCIFPKLLSERRPSAERPLLSVAYCWIDYLEKVGVTVWTEWIRMTSLMGISSTVSKKKKKKIAQLGASDIVWCFTWSVHQSSPFQFVRMFI